MAQRILFKDSGLGSSNNPLSGYKFVGYNGLTFSQLDSDGNIIAIAGSGSGSGLNTASNGLSVLGDSVQIGGFLNQNTTIDALNYGLYFQGNNEIDNFVNDLNSFPDIYGQVNLTSQTYDARIASLSGNTFSRVLIQSNGLILENQDESGSQVAIQAFLTTSSVGDNSSNNRLVVIDDLSQKGLVYSGDYTSNFTTYSLVTKGYVDSLSSGGVTGTPGYYTKFGAGGTISTSSSIYQTGNIFDVINCDNWKVYPGPSSSYSQPYFQATKEHSDGGSLTVRGNLSLDRLSSYVKLFPDNRTSAVNYNIISRSGGSNFINVGIWNKLITKTNMFDSEYGGFGTGERVGVMTDIHTISDSTSYGQVMTITGTGSTKYGDFIVISGVNSGNSYGVYVDVTQASSNNYGIYVQNGKSYFGGSVGVGTANPDSNAILDLSSTTKGFLPPRMTADQANAAFGTQSTVPDGMIIYITATSSDPAVDECFFDVGWYGKQDAPGAGYPGTSGGFNWVKFGYYSYG